MTDLIFSDIPKSAHKIYNTSRCKRLGLNIIQKKKTITVKEEQFFVIHSYKDTHLYLAIFFCATFLPLSWSTWHDLA